MIPAHGRSRPLTAADLGLDSAAVVRLTGRISVRRQLMTVRVETIEIAKHLRARTSLSGMINSLKTMARLGAMNRLVIEGVDVGNTRLARILVIRYGGAYTPQRTIVITLSLQ